ncbi:uncharacterized protein E0L32_002255 [Thyridium curvatum]|uniref:Major facilitator superfamily (MFS) profile domain-containing protein n=1 Tax=Thyridium curvatum TaxID=1093900 RepID=A0A507APK3_9PEZI|nr:uncharacterized protein E0L32_002255 [Thyridium curvatum]TPX06759.1 hypothetical protein E0L32_002255 [Thyridium curvatum]
MAPFNTGNRSEDQVTQLVKEDKTHWYKKRNLRYLYMMLFCCCMGVEMTSGFDSQLMNTNQYSQQFNKYFGKGHKSKGKYAIEAGLLGFMTSCYQLGTICAVPIGPWVNQTFGRRWSIMIGSLIMVVGAILQGFSQHVAMYIIARMMLGFGICFCIMAGSAMTAELGYPKERAVLTCLFNQAYYIGAITAAAISLRTVDLSDNWAWRIPSLLQICPSLLQICTVFLIPESPRWLVSRDREEEAYNILVKYHAEGDAANPIVHAEMAQIRSTVKLEMENAKMSWMDMVRTAGMRRRVFIIALQGAFTQLSGSNLFSYYSSLLYEMMGYNNNYAKTRINIAYLCWHAIVALPIAIYAVRFPRRWAFMTATTGMLICFISITICFERLKAADSQGQHNQAASIASLFFYFAYTLPSNIGNQALQYTYVVELFPYATRSRGVGVHQFFGKAAGFLSSNVNPIGMTAIGWKYFAVYCGWITFELICQFCFYPETYNRTLEELTFLFEPEEYRAQQHAAVEKELQAEGGGGEHVEEHASRKEVV